MATEGPLLPTGLATSAVVGTVVGSCGWQGFRGEHSQLPGEHQVETTTPLTGQWLSTATQGGYFLSTLDYIALLTISQ